jgi:thioesterase domain-containing protein
VTEGDAFASLLQLRAAGTGAPLFCVHPAAGIGWVYSGLLRHTDRPVYALQARGLSQPDNLPGSWDELIKDYLDQIRTVQPTGPYYLLGWSFGANVAYALAAVLQAEGQQVALLAMLDGYPPDDTAPAPRPSRDPSLLADLLTSVGYPAPAEPPSWDRFVAQVLGGTGPLSTVDVHRLSALAESFAQALVLRRTAAPTGVAGDLLFFEATADRSPTKPTPTAWRPYLTGGVEVHEIDCRHGEMTRPGVIDRIGTVLADRLRAGRPNPQES